jgi:hypothetical protein
MDLPGRGLHRRTRIAVLPLFPSRLHLLHFQRVQPPLGDRRIGWAPHLLKGRQRLAEQFYSPLPVVGLAAGRVGIRPIQAEAGSVPAQAIAGTEFGLRFMSRQRLRPTSFGASEQPRQPEQEGFFFATSALF